MNDVATVMNRCYAMMDSRMRWRSWLVMPDTVADHARLVTQAAKAGHVLFASVQAFAQPGNVAGLTRWQQVKHRYTGEDALPHLAPLYFDIDCEGALDKALIWARSLVEFFAGQLELPEPAVRVWFSGAKGVHIFVDPTAMGIQPNPALTTDMKAVAMDLIKHLASTGQPDMTIDSGVYSLPRMIRLADQLNPKSGLYKVELYHRELMQLSAEKISHLAASPRGSLWTAHDMPDGPVLPAARWWAEALARAREPREFRIKTAQVAGLEVRPDGYLVDELADPTIPACINGMMQATVGPGIRNRCELQIACWAKAARVSQMAATSMLAAWTARNRPELSSGNADAKARSIVNAVFCNASYGFSCAAAGSAARAAGVVPRCDACRAVRPHSLRQVFSLRIRHDERWKAPSRISLEESRGLIARAIEQRIAAAGANRPGRIASGQRQDSRGAGGPGPERRAGRVRHADARSGHPGPARSRRAGCQDALLASGT